MIEFFGDKMSNESLSERWQLYAESIGRFYSIRDEIMSPDYHKPGVRYLNDIINMGFHLKGANQTGFSMRRHYKEFRKVKRELKRRGAMMTEINADRISSPNVLDAIANAKI